MIKLRDITKCFINYKYNVFCNLPGKRKLINGVSVFEMTYNITEIVIYTGMGKVVYMENI